MKYEEYVIDHQLDQFCKISLKFFSSVLISNIANVYLNFFRTDVTASKTFASIQFLEMRHCISEVGHKAEILRYIGALLVFSSRCRKNPLNCNVVGLKPASCWTFPLSQSISPVVYTKIGPLNRRNSYNFPSKTKA